MLKLSSPYPYVINNIRNEILAMSNHLRLECEFLNLKYCFGSLHVAAGWPLVQERLSEGWMISEYWRIMESISERGLFKIVVNLDSGITPNVVILVCFLIASIRSLPSSLRC